MPDAFYAEQTLLLLLFESVAIPAFSRDERNNLNYVKYPIFHSTD